MAYTLPFFKNYPVDWLMSEKVACMTLQEVGAYKLLADHQWVGPHCTLPDDPARLKALIKWEDEKYGDFGRVLACFPRLRSPKGRRGNARLLKEYAEAMALQTVAIESGLKGAAKRWKKPIDKPLVNGAATWDAYQSAYRARYHVEPVRNQQVNSHLKQLVARLGSEDAPRVAAFYLTHNKPFYVSARHSTNLLLRDAEGLRTEWATGIKATTGEAKQAEVQDDARAQIDRVRAKLEGRA